MSPELGGRPQQMINDRLLAHADVLVGIFWSRIGSPTGKEISGTVEEIKNHHSKNKPVMLYFSEEPIVPSIIDIDQYKLLQEFKNWTKTQGIINEFSSRDQFKAKFSIHLNIMIRDNDYIKNIIGEYKSPNPIGTIEDFTESLNSALNFKGKISEDAKELLLTAAADRNGNIMVLKFIGGTSIQANGRIFGDEGNRRSIAKWEAAIEDLEKNNLIRDVSEKRDFYQITNNGYEFIETKS
jgi:hypothetical protein